DFTQHKTLSGTSAPTKESDEIGGPENRIQRPLLIAGELIVPRDARRQRRMHAPAISRGLHDFPFARQHITMRNLVFSRTKIFARCCFSFDAFGRDSGSAGSFERVSPKLVFVNHRTSLKQMPLRPSHRVSHRKFARIFANSN